MRVLLLSFFIIVADQVTKLLVKGIHIPALGISHDGRMYGLSTPLIGDFLRLTYIENPGMAFGIDLGGKLFFSLFSIFASMAILYYLYRAREENLGFRISLALILGGAIGNLIDRTFYGMIFNEAPLFYGRVVDFLDMAFFKIDIGPRKILFFDFRGIQMSRWPIFNIADASVTLGVIMLLFFHRRADVEAEDPVPALPAQEPPANSPGSSSSEHEGKSN